MSASPIFDQLIVEFAEKRDTHFPRLIQAHEIMTKTYEPVIEPEQNDVTKDTEFEATRLKVVRPAIPEMEKYTKPEVDEDATQTFDVVKEVFEQHIATADEMREGAGVVTPETGTHRKTLGEALQEADKEVGLDDFDEAFAKADELLKPSGFVRVDAVMTQTGQDLVKKAVEGGHVTPIIKPGTVIPIKRGRLPRRSNKRGTANPKPKNDPHFSFFDESDTTTSPGSAA